MTETKLAKNRSMTQEEQKFDSRRTEVQLTHD